MESSFKQLVTALNLSSPSTNVLLQLIQILEQQSDIPFDSLLLLQQWAWQLLTQNPSQWINQPYYQQLFHSLASFNKNFIFTCDHISTDTKAKLLFSVSIEQINDIFHRIEQSNDDSFINIAALWFDNYSYFLHRNPHCNVLFNIYHINQYIVNNYLLSEQFKFYLTQLQQLHLADEIFTTKMLFYMKTCLFFLSSYIGARVDSFSSTADEILRFTGVNYLSIVRIHSRTVASWSKKLLGCMAHLISFISKICWWDGYNRIETKILFSTQQIMCDHVQELTHIIAHKPFQTQINALRSNDETILIQTAVLFLLIIAQTQTVNWFFRSNIAIQKTLLTVAEISLFDEICLCAYGVLGEVVTEEELRDLKIVDTISGFFFNMLEQAWHHPSKQYNQIPIDYLLRGKKLLVIQISLF